MYFRILVRCLSEHDDTKNIDLIELPFREGVTGHFIMSGIHFSTNGTAGWTFQSFLNDFSIILRSKKIDNFFFWCCFLYAYTI